MLLIPKDISICNLPEQKTEQRCFLMFRCSQNDRIFPLCNWQLYKLRFVSYINEEENEAKSVIFLSVVNIVMEIQD